MTSSIKRCFVISPIGDSGTEIRQRSDQIFKHIITPAVNSCGYMEVVRADMLAEPGLITSQVVQHLIDDDLVVADLTGRNPNVFYELAIRHAIRKPFVQLIQSGETIPFDIAGMRTISVDHHNLDSVAECITEITNQVRAAESSPDLIETPISVTVNMQSLRQSGNPSDRASAEILSIVQSLQFTLDEKLEGALRRSDRLNIRDTSTSEFMSNIVKSIDLLLRRTWLDEDNRQDFDVLSPIWDTLSSLEKLCEITGIPLRLTPEIKEFQKKFIPF